MRECEWCHNEATTLVVVKTAPKPFSVRVCDPCIDEAARIYLFTEKDEYTTLRRRSIISGQLQRRS